MNVSRTLAAAAVLLLAAQAGAAEPLSLHARFTLAPGEQWSTVQIPLTPAAWRVGAADGRMPTDAELRAAVRGLQAVEVGARCAGWVDRDTGYPCGVAVQGVAGDGPSFATHAVGWQVSAAARERSAARSTPELRAAGLMAAVADAPQRVAAQLPAAVLDAATGVLRFRIRAVSNPLVPSIFERDSGEVVLQPGPAPVAAPV